MTNREWLESLPDAELAHAMLNLRDIAPRYFSGYTDSSYGITLWLKEEHKDDEARKVPNSMRIG